MKNKNRAKFPKFSLFGATNGQRSFWAVLFGCLFVAGFCRGFVCFFCVCVVVVVVVLCVGGGLCVCGGGGVFLNFLLLFICFVSFCLFVFVVWFVLFTSFLT